jgi:hypothetical protein
MEDSAERRWMAQWRAAAVALADQRARELAEMTDAAALVAAEAVLSLAAIASLHVDRLESSGLVELEALLHRHRGA